RAALLAEPRAVPRDRDEESLRRRPAPPLRRAGERARADHRRGRRGRVSPAFFRDARVLRELLQRSDGPVGSTHRHRDEPGLSGANLVTVSELDGRCGTCAAFTRVREDPALGKVGECALEVYPPPVRATATCSRYRPKGALAPAPKPRAAGEPRKG